MATCGFTAVPYTSPRAFISRSTAPTCCTSLKTRVFSVFAKSYGPLLPTWSTTAPWNFSQEPRLLRNWKYCTEFEPCAIACIDESRCMPGRLSIETGVQFVMLGVLSIRRKFSCFTERITSCAIAEKTAISVLSAVCHCG